MGTGNFEYVWFWRKWLPERKGQRCRVVARGRMNAALIEFDDGSKVVSSRFAARKAGRDDLQTRLELGDGQ